MTRELYKDDKITIYDTKVPDEHEIKAGNLFCYFSRGILRQLSTRNSEGLRQDLENVNRDFLMRLGRQGISLEELGWALSKARINELEQEVQYFVREYNELKTRIE